MKKSEFIAMVASERSKLEVYAEWPDGSYEWAAANAQRLIPLVDYAINGLERLEKPVNAKTLEEQFIYCFHMWKRGELEITSSGKVWKIQPSEKSRTQGHALQEMFRAYIKER